jgi:hypothetical protein
MKELIRWGAFGVEVFLLFVLVCCVYICSCPPTPANLGQFSLLAIGAGACAYLSSFQFRPRDTAGRRKLMQIVLEPPIALWILLILLLLEQLTHPGCADHGYRLYRIR